MKELNVTRLNDMALDYFFHRAGITYQAYKFDNRYVKVFIIHQQKNYSIHEIIDKLSQYILKNIDYVYINEFNIIL